MFNITCQSSAVGAKAYFAQADYYSQGQEVTGRWYGESAKLLGLQGLVQQRDFDRMCDNLHPQTGEQLTAKNLDNRRVGYDFTFSAPKSVSIVQALTSDESILTAWQGSIHATMSEMEAEVATRVRKGGQDTDRTTGNWLYAEFLHHTSRPVNGIPAPQLHSHCFAFNATYDQIEGEWKAAQLGQIKHDAFYWQAVQQNRFAQALQSIGYEVRRTKDAFEIVGVTAQAIDRFSPRTKQIEAAAARLGITKPAMKAQLGATTREAKNKELPYHELIETWRTWLSDADKTLLATLKHETPQLEPDQSRAMLNYSLQHHLERQSVIPERRVLATALKEGIGRSTVATLRKAWSQTTKLTKQEQQTTWVTTPEVLATEQSLLNLARAGRGTCRPLATKPEIQIQRSFLNQEQRQVIEHVLTSADRYLLIRGAAGTGKTTLTQEAVEQLEQRGQSVVMLAPSAKASRGVLRDEGFAEADTLAKFMKDKKFQAQAQDGIIWLDEASLVGTKTMQQLFALAESINARVVCAGDQWQHGSIERSSALPALAEYAGLPVAEVTAIQRQQVADYKATVALLSQGKALQGLVALEEQGRVKLMDPEQPYQAVAQDYVQKYAASEQPDKTVLVVCPTHAEAAELSTSIREELQQQNLLSRDERTVAQLVAEPWTVAERSNPELYRGNEILQFHHQTGPFKAGQRIELTGDSKPVTQAKPEHFAVYRPGTINFAPGEQIRLTANGKTLDGKRVNNGDLFTLKRFTKDGDLEFTNGKILSADYGHWTHGYVSTSQASQGRTVNHVLLVQSGRSHYASSQEGLYVAASRGRQSVMIFTDSLDDLRQAVSRSEAKRSATEVFTVPKQQPVSQTTWQCWQVQLRRTQQRVLQAAKRFWQEVSPVIHQQEQQHERA